MKKLAIVLNNVKISGGCNVILEHAIYAYNQGTDITWISNKHIDYSEASWHPGAEVIKFKTFEECGDVIFDVAMATAWFHYR